MFNSTNGFTMPVVPQGTNGGFGSGWGDGAWFIWIILIFAIFGGWGNGWGNNGSGGVLDQYVLNSDFSTLSRQMESGFDGLRQQSTSIANGICSLGYDQLAQFNGINTNIAASTYDLRNAIQNSDITNMQNTNAIGAQITALGTQMASCCCDQKYNTATQFADVNYRLATDTCAINTNLSNVARDIIDNDNANYRALDARLTAMEASAKDEKIATLQSQLSDARLIANNNAQTAVFTNAINDAVARLIPPTPIPAYQVNPPFQYTGCGCGCSCS